MKQHKLSYILFVLLFIALATMAAGQWIVPVNCKTFEASRFRPETSYTEGDDICFYGTGFYQAPLEIRLTGERNYSLTYNLSARAISSLAGEYQFSDVRSGRYNLSIERQGEITQYYKEIVVGNKDEAIPEFQSLGIAMLLGGAILIVVFARRGL